MECEQSVFQGGYGFSTSPVKEDINQFITTTTALASAIAQGLSLWILLLCKHSTHKTIICTTPICKPCLVGIKKIITV
jgi:hypothetical protein